MESPCQQMEHFVGYLGYFMVQQHCVVFFRNLGDI